MAGLMPGPSTVSYAASKSAVAGLSTCLRCEAAAAGVRVSVLCPGQFACLAIIPYAFHDEVPGCKDRGAAQSSQALRLLSDGLGGVCATRPLLEMEGLAPSFEHAFRKSIPLRHLGSFRRSGGRTYRLLPSLTRSPDGNVSIFHAGVIACKT